MAEQTVLPDDTSAAPPTSRRIAVSVVEDGNVVSLVLPDTLVALALGGDTDEIAEMLTAGAEADRAFVRDGGHIIESVAHQERGDFRARPTATATDKSKLWLRAAVDVVALGAALAGWAPAAPMTGALLDSLIENEELRLKALRLLQRGGDDSQVELHSPTGDFTYTLPIPIDQMFTSSEVGKLLSPTGKGLRTIAKQRRDANELLGVKIGNQFRHPKFQFDVGRHEIIPVVAYANRALECSADPWGTLEWWFTPESAFDDQSPVGLLTTGELDENMIDDAVAFAGRGMD